jgi:uncharacterized OsmC-like protein
VASLYVSKRNDNLMRKITQIIIEHVVVTSDRSYEQVIEALEAQLERCPEELSSI